MVRGWVNCLGVGVVALGGSGVFAAGSAAEPATEPTVINAPKLTLEPGEGPNSIDTWLMDAYGRPAGVFRYGPVSLFDPVWKGMNKELDKVGLSVGLAYTAILQVASNGPGMRDAAGGDFDLFGNWRLWGKKEDETTGYLYFASEWRGSLFADQRPSQLGGQIGSLWGTVNGFSEQVYTMKELYWEQRFDKDRVVVRIGKLDPENYYNTNYWQSDSKYFMNAAFSTFPVRAFPGQGLGINVLTKLTNEWYVTAGVQDAQGKKTTPGFDTLFQDFNLFSAGEVGYMPTIPGVGKGTYRLTGWYRDAGDSNGKAHDAGVDLSIDQKVGEHFTPFFRYGTGEGNINGINNMVSGGVGWEGQMISKTDVVGLGGAWGQPSGPSLRDQFALEFFYRVQVSPDNQLTLGYQVIFDPTNAPNEDVVGVFELRWRITF
ncbi:MAG: carbohydrate porin [Phycisphaerae bacterium]